MCCEFSKTITIADVVVLDRVCSFSLKSVMDMVRRIDSAEKEADSVKLTEFIIRIYITKKIQFLFFFDRTRNSELHLLCFY